MTLIILLMVLVGERVAFQSSIWSTHYYLGPYSRWFLAKTKQDDFNQWHLLLLLVLPTFISLVLLELLGGGLIEFVASVLVLAVVLGNARARKYYRQYLNALSRDDKEAQQLLAAKLASKNLTIDDEQLNQLSEMSYQEVGSNLIWINFKYYAAPIFYFVVLGLPGVIFYATLLYCYEQQLLNKVNPELSNQLTRYQEWVFWLPARLVSIGFMVVGHFTNGLEAWLKYAANVSVTSYTMLTKVALKSDAFDVEKASSVQHMVRLTKRNMVLFIVAIALLTLYGQVI